MNDQDFLLVLSLDDGAADLVVDSVEAVGARVVKPGGRGATWLKTRQPAV